MEWMSVAGYSVAASIFLSMANIMPPAMTQRAIRIAQLLLEAE